MTQIINSISSSDQLTILLVDEFYACVDDGQVSADWSDLPTANNKSPLTVCLNRVRNISKPGSDPPQFMNTMID